MDKLVRKIEVPLAKSAITDAGLYIASPEDIGRLAEVAMEAYQDYPLHNWLTNGHYDREASKRIMEVSLRTMANDGVIYADSPELNGFAAGLYRQQDRSLPDQRRASSDPARRPRHYRQAADIRDLRHAIEGEVHG